MTGAVAAVLVAGGVLGAVSCGLVPGTGGMRLSRALGPKAGSTGAAAVRAAPLRIAAAVDRISGRRAARRRRAAVLVCRAFATELAAGRPPGPALAAAAREGGLAGELGPALAAAEAGADPVPHLHRAAETPGLGGAARLAACWTVAAVSGAGLADVAERLAAALAREEAQRADLSAQLAGARTTAVLLAVLPAGGLLMAAFSGGAPLAFLFGSPAGLACLAGGAALDAAGLWWTRGIIRRALPPAEGR